VAKQFYNYLIEVVSDTADPKIRERNKIMVALFLCQYGLTTTMLDEKTILELEAEKAELLREFLGPLRRLEIWYDDDTQIRYVPDTNSFIFLTSRDISRFLETSIKRFEGEGVHLMITSSLPLPRPLYIS